jgi:hypothetical protein
MSEKLTPAFAPKFTWAIDNVRLNSANAVNKNNFFIINGFN